MIIVTFVRHGESADNVKSVWAGWKDAALTNHGMNQAKALASSFSPPPSAIHTSDLRRAHQTASQLLQAFPSVPFEVHPSLREQNFGIAEGKKFTFDAVPIDAEKEVFPAVREENETPRGYKFPEGESLDELAVRAGGAIEEIVIPAILRCVGRSVKANNNNPGGEGEKEDGAGAEKERGEHVVIVSHGLCISELLGNLMVRAGERGLKSRSFSGLANTAWTRVWLGVKGEEKGDVTTATGDEIIPTQPLKLYVAIKATNNKDHLANLTRQAGGIGSATHDPAQQDIRKFFGGGDATAEGGTTISKS